MKRVFVTLLALLVWGCCTVCEQPAPEPEPEPVQPGPARTMVFTADDVSGEYAVTVTITATASVPQSMLEHLRRQLLIRRLDDTELLEPEYQFWTDRAMAINHEHAEVSVELTPADAGLDPAQFVWMWPDGFEAARPGVIRVLHSFEEAGAAGASPGGPGVTVKKHDAPRFTRLRGHLVCQLGGGGSSASSAHDLSHLKLEIGDYETVTDANGFFDLPGAFDSPLEQLKMRFDSDVTSSSVTTRLQVMNDRHASHSDTLRSLSGTASGDVLDLGLITVDRRDCEAWRIGVRVLEDYHRDVHDSPPAGELRIKRFGGVVVGGAYTFYDYIVLPTDWIDEYGELDREWVIAHEFGHSIRHVADGSVWHWNWDNFRWAYGRLNHNGNEVTNVQFAFNEGWANYWSIPEDDFCGRMAGLPGPGFMDWNECLVGERLDDLSDEESREFMVQVLVDHPRHIHSLYEFEQRYCEAASASNVYCTADEDPVRAHPAACPPDYHDDGETCRLDNIKAKPSRGRGGGVPPKECGPGREYDAGLCYPDCPPGYKGVGPVCWERCRSGYHDDGATCRRDARIISADNSDCPWWDKCGLGLARGCSHCPSGYSNDGCTCRRNAHIYGKQTQGRGVGTVPDRCGSGRELDAGLCYPPCEPGFTGIGPVCWGSCPPGYDDHGATCYRPPRIIVK